MSEDELGFYCATCATRIGTIEQDGVLRLGSVLAIRADLVCRCGTAIYWHRHKIRMDQLIERVLAMRSATSAPASVILT